MNKIIRSICVFTNNLDSDYAAVHKRIEDKLVNAGFSIQTKRLCVSGKTIKELNEGVDSELQFISAGRLSLNQAKEQLNVFVDQRRVTFNMDLTGEDISSEHANILFDVIRQNPANTFNFSYSFNTPASSPYFTSTYCGQEGFSIGLQPTDLSEGCNSLQEWLDNMKATWSEIMNLLQDEEGFLGIDSSIAPLFSGNSSFIEFIRHLGIDFSSSVTTDIYTQISRFIKSENPKPVGLCGLMFPALEDFALAEEYEQGNFTIERNIYLSLHSGLGIDTYPIGVDEKVERVVDILKLIQALSNKYKKPLAVRFVSDGKAKIGEKAEFKNEYLKDVVINAL